MTALIRNLENLFEKGTAFIRNINKEDKILVVYHKDVDGLVSAILLMKAFEKIGLKHSKVMASSNDEMEKMIEEMRHFDRILVLDIDISFMKRELESLGKDIMIIDHHPPRADLNGKTIIYINPRLEVPKIYQPASYVIYKFLPGISDLSNEEWLAALGTVGDFGFEDCEDLVRKYVDVKSKRELPNTSMWLTVEKMIGVITELGFEKAFGLISSLDSLESLERNEEIGKIYEGYRKKLERYEEMFWKNAKKIDDAHLIISELSTEHRTISSLLSTKISGRLPDKVVVIMRKVGGNYSVNARYNESEIHVGIEMGEIMERCAKGMNGGGGHAHAAGATISADKRAIFEERLVKELRRFFEKSKSK